MPRTLFYPVPYNGGKRRQLPVILEHAPKEYTTFVEAFGGGGALTFWMAQNAEVNQVYNELSPRVVATMLALKDREQCEAIQTEYNEMKSDRETFMRFKSEPTKSIPMAFYLAKASFLGSMGKWSSFNPNKKKAYLDLSKYPETLERVEIRSVCALKVLDDYKDDETAWLYLDPPYIGTDCRGYHEVDKGKIDKLYDIVKDRRYRCKIMLHTEVSKEHDDPTIKLEYAYASGRNKDKKKTHGLWMNYNI